MNNYNNNNNRYGYTERAVPRTPYTCVYIFVIIFIWWSPLIPSRNLDEVSLITIRLYCSFETALMLKHPWF